MKSSSISLLLILISLAAPMVRVSAASLCREWGHSEQGRWNVDEGCCAREGQMACVDGYRPQSGSLCRGCSHSYECVPCDADDAACQGNLAVDGVEYEEGDCPSALYTAYSCAGSPRGEVVRAAATRAGAALSILGSAHILALVGGKWRSNRKEVDPYQRIMAAYSAYDILFSFFFYFMGSWMTPAETGWYGAVGNVGTCSTQGFFYMFGFVASMLCQVMYLLQMLLLVAYKWRSSQFERRIEYRMHGSILAFATTVASVPLFFQGYNPWCGFCGPVPLPDWCGTDSTTECVRGNTVISNVYFRIFILVLVIATVLFCTGAMIRIYRSVRKQERRNSSFRHGNDSENRTMSDRIRKSMVLYTCSFYLCWIVSPMLINLPLPSALRVVGFTIMPLMGFLNMLVFLLLKCIRYQKDHTGVWLPTAYLHVLFEGPLGAINRWSSLWGSGSRGDGADADNSDGIGLGTYNERAGAPVENPVPDPAG